MTHFNRCLWVGLVAFSAGQVVYALPRVESRVIPGGDSRVIPGEPRAIPGGSSPAISGDSPQPGLSEEVLDQISALQKEVQELRGLVETQEHELKRVEKSQQTLFLNLEKQLADGPSKKGTTVPSGVISSLKSAASTSVAISPVIKKEEPPEKVSGAGSDAVLLKTAETFLKQKKYLDAEKNYQAYLEAHPTGEFAPGVYYTLGEIYWTEWHTEKSNTLLLEKAVHAFSDVANGFPEHAKAKDALLKIGLVEIEKGNYQTAAQYFKKVIDKYPQSPSAKIAELRLQKLTQDGRIS